MNYCAVTRPVACFLLAIILTTPLQRAHAELPDLGGNAFNTITPEKEKQLGDVMMRQTRGSLPMVYDPLLDEYINSLGNKLVARANDVKFPFRFYWVNNKNINAFATLGGNITSHTGTLAVAARQDNLISTATVFCLLGCNWPQALELSERCFELVDQRHGNSSSPSPLLPNADRVLQQLHDAGIQLAVISNDTRSGIQSFLNHHGLSDRFSDCWSADDQPRKPNPAAVHQLCQRLNLTPERCALIGDAETDLSMARTAGIGCVIGYLGGWAKQPELPSAIYLLTDWDELGLITTP